jgi:uncharacterized protein
MGQVARERGARVSRTLQWLGRAGMASVTTLGMVGWYGAGQVVTPRYIGPSTVTVLEVDDRTITLERTDKTARGSVWGLRWNGGYGHATAILHDDPDRVVRGFRLLYGAPPTPGKVEVDVEAFPEDPRRAHGIPYREVLVPSPLGSFPAWRVDGPRTTWVLFVHGRAATRRESLRMLPAVTSLGFPSLAITYRNDTGAPASADGKYGLGVTEWEDLDAAAKYALGNGAENLVLVGYSMGGAIVARFLTHSPLATEVRAVILDSPALDWKTTVAHFGREYRIPRPVTETATGMFSIRYAKEWEDLDALARADDLAAPVLLFHGTADRSVPPGPSAKLAHTRPDLVRFQPVAGAGHVESWNADPEAYETSVQRFLRSLPTWYPLPEVPKPG